MGRRAACSTRSLLVGAFLLAGPALTQTTWYVDVNGTPPGTGSQADPYTSIQYAIEQPATVDLDTILVSPGTCLENVDLDAPAAYWPCVELPGLVPRGEPGKHVELHGRRQDHL